MQDTEKEAALILVPLFFFTFGAGLLWMYFFKPPTYYCSSPQTQLDCPFPETQEEMQTPPSFIEDHSEIECEELPGGVTLCPKG